MTEPVPAVEPEAPPLPWLEEMPPRQIVAELDRYIVGQDAAKRAIAIAVRNRWRRSQAPEQIRDEITPSNIILIGPTALRETSDAPPAGSRAGARRRAGARHPPPNTLAAAPGGGGGRETRGGGGSCSPPARGRADQ